MRRRETQRRMRGLIALGAMIVVATAVLAPVKAVPSASTSAPELYDVFDFSGFDGQERAGGNLFRYTLTTPGAECNDGSPAIIYVRPSESGRHRDDWVIYFDAGSSALASSTDGLWEAARIRWEGHGSEPFNNTWKMSTDPNHDGVVDEPLAIDLFGIFQRTPAHTSTFAEYNQVYLNYCSSDLWLGRSPVLTIEHSSLGRPFQIRYRGRLIVEAAVEALRDGVRPDGFESNPSANFTMPSLEDAREVIVAGTSAGANGAIWHLDWFDDELDAKVTGITGADIKPLTEHLDPDGVIRTFLEARWEFTVPLIDAATDESCVEELGDSPEGWRCTFATEVLVNHLDPDRKVFVRQDLCDFKVSSAYRDEPGCDEDFADAVRETLEDLGERLKFSSWWAPSCEHHEGLSNANHYFLTFLKFHGTLEWNYDQALEHWSRGGRVRNVEVSATDPAFPLSTCP